LLFLKRLITIIVVLITLTIYAVPAFANVGTPMVWFVSFHLLLGNLFIALFEAYLIKKFFKTHYLKTALFLIIANYVSCYAGLIIARYSTLLVIDVNLLNALGFIVTSTFLLILLTIVIEWPFFLLIFRKEQDRLLKSIKASIVAQMASYSILIVFSVLLSDISLITKVEYQKPSDFGIKLNCHIYYIAADGDIYKSDFQGNVEFATEDRLEKSERARLIATQKDQSNTCAISIYERENRTTRIVMDDIRCDYGHFHNSPTELLGAGDTWMNFGEVKFFDKNPYRVETHFWSAGFSVRKSKDNLFYLTLNTPIVAVDARNAMCVEKNILVYEALSNYLLFGESNQIYLLDVENLKSAMLAKGTGPALICENADQSAETNEP